MSLSLVGLCLSEIVASVPLVYGPWKALKRIFKEAEARGDTAVCGALAARFDATFAGAAHGVSRETLGYLARRARRYLRRIGQTLPAAHADIACDVLAASGDDTAASGAEAPVAAFARRYIRRHHPAVGLAVHGLFAGRSTITNAERHGSSQTLLQMDLKDFLPTVTCSFPPDRSFGPITRSAKMLAIMALAVIASPARAESPSHEEVLKPPLSSTSALFASGETLVSPVLSTRQHILKRWDSRLPCRDRMRSLRFPEAFANRPSKKVRKSSSPSLTDGPSAGRHAQGTCRPGRDRCPSRRPSPVRHGAQRYPHRRPTSRAAARVKRKPRLSSATMFDEPNEGPADRPIDPADAAREKSDQFRMHAELAAVFEGHRKFDAQLLPGLDPEVARDLQRTIGRLEKAKSPDSPLLPAPSVADAAGLLNLAVTGGLSTGDYHIHRRPGEVMIVRWLAGDGVETFYERLQAHFDAALEGFKEDERQAKAWKQDPKTLAYLAALDAIDVRMGERYLRDPIRAHNLFVLSTQSADEINIAYLTEDVMGTSAADVVGAAAAPRDGPTEQDLAWFFKLFSLRGMIGGVERMCFFTFLQKADDSGW